MDTFSLVDLNNTYANSVDPDETACNVMSCHIWIYTVCHSVFYFKLKPLLALVAKSKFKDGRVHFRAKR